MLETLQSTTILPISILVFGLFSISRIPVAEGLRKHLNMLSTQVWMILITSMLSIVMIRLFLFPIQQKSQHHQAATNK